MIIIMIIIMIMIIMIIVINIIYIIDCPSFDTWAVKTRLRVTKYADTVRRYVL